MGLVLDKLCVGVVELEHWNPAIRLLTYFSTVNVKHNISTTEP